jgi:hypothetical protein
MRLTTILGLVFLSTMMFAGCGGEAPAAETSALDSLDDNGKPEPPMLGAHPIKGAHGNNSGGSSSPNMTLHGGNVMPTMEIQPIFWGPSWSNASFTADKMTGIAQLYTGFIGSSYANTNGEYAGVNSAYVGIDRKSISYTAALTDLSATPNHAPKTSAVLAEVCKEITQPTADGYYPVYTDIPRGSASYCAWHSWGSCNGVNVQFGFFFKLDGDAGCDPQDTTSTRSQGLSALANVSGHEISETLTDPRGTAWYDASGGENGDKCAWVFDDLVELSDKSLWKVQGNWSNAAYTAGTGYANMTGQKGCLYAR